MVKQKYGKIYSVGFILPTVEKILLDEFGLKELVFEMSSKRKEIADYLENTDLPIALGDIFDSIYDDTPVEDVLKQLKDMGYDEKFYEESFQDLEGNYLLPNFDPSSYETMMEYYVHDLLNYEDYHDQLGISDGVIYRMLQNNR